MTASTEPEDPALADLLRRADASVETPADLWERTKAPRPGAGRSARVPLLVAAATALILAGGAFGGGLLMGRHQASRHGPVSQSGRPVLITVYNAEAACRSLRTLECSFGVRERPAKKGSKVVARVWHGDRVRADCVETDGDLVTDEAGVTSTRWYHVALPGSEATGWLPGVRTRNTTEVPVCPHGRV